MRALRIAFACARHAIDADRDAALPRCGLERENDHQRQCYTRARLLFRRDLPSSRATTILPVTASSSSSASAHTATPAMRQYLDVKRQHRDAIVLFRMGDFYEMFYEDALTASRVLELTLTSRAKDRRARRSRCAACRSTRSTPTSRGWCAKGYRVAICDQVEDPRKAKGHRQARGHARRLARDVHRRRRISRLGSRRFSRRSRSRTAARCGGWRFSTSRRASSPPPSSPAPAPCRRCARSSRCCGRAKLLVADGGERRRPARRLVRVSRDALVELDVRGRRARAKRCARSSHASLAGYGARDAPPRRLPRPARSSRTCGTPSAPSSPTSATSRCASAATRCSSIQSRCGT